MQNLSEFELYEEIQSYFYLDGEELLYKLNANMDELSNRVYGMDCFFSCESGNVMVVLNRSQAAIMSLYNTLINLWLIRH